MSVIRQGSWLGQMRVDVPHLRAIDSSIAADFDLLAGKIQAGGQALIVRGFEMVTASVALGTTLPSALQINPAGGVLVHPLASEAGSIFSVPDDAEVETLSATNSKVLGGFTANAVNYIGIDLRRQADASTSDLVMFLDANSLQETPKTVPLARTLDFVINVSTLDFDATPHLAPIAKVTLNSSGVVTGIEDARQMMFRLGSGGTAPNNSNAYSWPQGRMVGTSVAQAFQGGDKGLGSGKEWGDAVMTRLWELGGGEAWSSATSDRDVKVVYGAVSLFPSNLNWRWNNTPNTLEWKSIGITFANSTAWYNTVTDGSITLLDGECIYVDINRAVNGAVLTVAKAPMLTLGSPTIPGSRFVLAWRSGAAVVARDYPFNVDRDVSNVPAGVGDPLNVLHEGSGGFYWDRTTSDEIVPIIDIQTFAPVDTVSIVGGLVEKDTSISTPAFTATYLYGPPTSASLVDDTLPGTDTLIPPAAAFSSTHGPFLKANTGGGSNNIVTFTLTADAGTSLNHTTPDTKTATLTWTRFHYAGTGTTASPTLNSAFVKGLAVTTGGTKVLSTTKGRRIQMLGGSAPVNAYVWFAHAEYMGSGSPTIGQPSVDLSIIDNLNGMNINSAYIYMGTAASVTTEVANSVGETFRVYRSINLQNGPIDITVGPAV